MIRLHLLRRWITQADRKMKDAYLRDCLEPKLHIGGGWHRLDGWLNTDIELIPGVMRMDAAQTFPFANETFQFAYSEHMIEHISQENGARMLKECYRALRHGGVIRVTTPDLAVLLRLHDKNLSDIQKKYLDWFYKAFLPEKTSPKPSSVINAFFRLWGHQFIYDEETLAIEMRAAGFDVIKRCRLGFSEYPSLQNLENVQRYPDGLLEFESVCLEGIKP